MNDPLIDQPAAASARRRLVRGVFATPVIMTICSGSTLAASSSAVKVINTQVTTQASFPAAPAATTWVRVQRYKAGPDYYVRGQDLPMAPGKSVYMNSSQYQKLKDGKITSSAPNGLAADGANYVAVRFDASGNVMGVVGDSLNSAGTSALTASVWASFISP